MQNVSGAGTFSEITEKLMGVSNSLDSALSGWQSGPIKY